MITKGLAKKFGLGSKKSKKSNKKVPPHKYALHKDFEDRLSSLNGRRIVEQFYASLNPDEYKMGASVMVKGVEVPVDIADISRHFRTELPSDLAMLGRMRQRVTWNDLFVKQNMNMANELVIQIMDFWVAPNYPLRHTNLKIELGLCHIFISHSLRPRTHQTTVAFEVAMLIHYI
ncbi:hypothetical protein Dsin_026698 [Dipteronia sinensis]|uniref:Uncharacterized protein n=1 Tax=Dipteronia sinensis TaxID=43782 RepID=A0AAD9ZZQ3_9ROSI|nr:hypothetical protein Dsin_026698 [Dipteronia sinensis]